MRPSLRKKLIGLYAAAALLGLSPTPGYATSCEPYLSRAESMYELPPGLLHALALTESGRTVRTADGRSSLVAWPYAVNADGKAYYFETLHEAVAGVRRLIEAGASQLDLGCLQINVSRWHKTAFDSLEQAFNPAINVAYGVGYLIDLRAESGSWTEAVARYHSRRAQAQRAYVCRVFEQLSRLHDRAGEARRAGPCRTQEG